MPGDSKIKYLMPPKKDRNGQIELDITKQEEKKA